jgi:hypothetical protein
MLNIFEVTFPFFALVLCGYLVTRRGWLAMEAIPALNVFVLYFALPCMLYRFGAATPIAKLLDATVFGIWLLCALLLIVFTMAGTRRAGWNDGAFGALVAVFPNSGFMGVPLLAGLLGPQAAAPVIVALVVDMVVTTSLCIALSRLGSAQDHGVRRALAGALKGMAVNPLPWAVALGCAVSAGGWALPNVLMKPVSMLADAATPVALFTLGAVLARAQRQSALQRGSAGGAGASAGMRRRSDVPLVAVCKLFLHPLLVLAMGHLAMGQGLAIDAFTVNVLALLAALPSASNVTMLAERYGADAGRIARIVLVTTGVAFFTFSGAVALLAPAVK